MPARLDYSIIPNMPVPYNPIYMFVMTRNGKFDSVVTALHERP